MTEARGERVTEGSEEQLVRAARRARSRSSHRVSVSPYAILRLVAQRDALRAGLEDAERALRKLAEPPDPRPRVDL